MKRVACLLFAGMALTACLDDDSSYGSDAFGRTIVIELEKGRFTDDRDGNKYAVVRIGNDYWMAENLRYIDSSETKNLKGNVWCYDNKTDSCSKYGPLYSWTAALDIDSKYGTERKGLLITEKQVGICPEGWHIPTSIEWDRLQNNLKKMNIDTAVGASMKSIEGWEQEGLATKAMNRFGFDAMAAGRRNSENGEFMSSGKYAFFWTADEYDEATATGKTLRYDRDNLESGMYYKDHGMSVRCVLNLDGVQLDGALDSSYLDKIPFEFGKLEYDGKKYKTIEIGSQTWMAENMNAKTEDSWCYNDDSKNCDKYGRLYSYEQAEKLCPEGWRLPTKFDVESLSNNVGHFGSALRSRDGWTDKGAKGWNLWGFNALPAGGRESGDFFDVALSAYMWVDGQSVMWLRYYNEAIEVLQKESGTAFPVRCIKE